MTLVSYICKIEHRIKDPSIKKATHLFVKKIRIDTLLPLDPIPTPTQQGKNKNNTSFGSK